MPEFPAIAPISRNIGIADRSQLAANTNGVSDREESATLKLRRYQKPPNATAPIATPIGRRSAISTSMAPRLTSESVRGLMWDPASRLRRQRRTVREVADHPQHQVEQHQAAGYRQHPAARPDRDIHRAGEPDLAGTGLAQCLQIRLIAEHRDVERREDLHDDLDPVVEPRRADVLEHAGDDVVVARRDP